MRAVIYRWVSIRDQVTKDEQRGVLHRRPTEACVRHFAVAFMTADRPSKRCYSGESSRATLICWRYPSCVDSSHDDSIFLR
jgi:hypothetical protein